MKKAFSMITIIFTVLIIGILATFTIPKFIGSSKHSKVNSMLKVLIEAESSVPPAFVNLVDMDLNTTAVHLDDLLTISNSNWKLLKDDDNANYNREGVVSSITLDVENRTISTHLDWSRVVDNNLRSSFETITGVEVGSTNRSVNIPF